MMRYSLRTKIFLLMGSLVLGILLATLLVISQQASRTARLRIIADLHGTRQQFETLQRQRYRSLLALSRVLGREYALRNAVATYDPPTVSTAIQSFQARIRSDYFLITDDQGALLAAVGGQESAPGTNPFVPATVQGAPAISEALEGRESLHIWRFQEGLYQVATVPLKAGPDILGTLSIGYAIDRALLRELQTITGSAITLLAGDTLLASTWDAEMQRELMAALTAATWPAQVSSADQDIRELALGGETYLSLAVPLMGGHGEHVGVYWLQQSLDQALDFLHRLQRVLMLTGVLAVGLALLVSFVIARGITAPIQQLVQGAEAVGRGDYQHRIAEAHSCTELGILARAYNAMTDQLAAHIEALQTAYGDLQKQAQALEASLRKVELLEKIQSHLGKFVPETVIHLIEETPEAPALDKRDRDVSVLFLDIAGYTRLSEANSREKMNALVERYFSSFLDAIHQNHGDINETAGDGLMILFQGDDPTNNASDAVRTAVAIQEKVAEINRTADSTDPIAINIGINSGIAAVGSTRFEGFTGGRWTYTASGPVTNTAARLAGLATNGEIYLGEETAARVQATFQLEFVGTRQVKNVQEPIHVYQVSPAEIPV